MTCSPARLAGGFAICALLGLAPLDSRAASVSFTKLNVHVDAFPVSGTAYHGYTPHRFKIHNSSNKKRKVTLTLPNRPTSDEFSIERITRTITVAPGTSIKVLLLQPPLTLGYSVNSVRVTVDGQTRYLANGYSQRIGDAYNTGNYKERVVLLSRSIDKTDLENKVTAKVGMSPGTSSGHYHGHGPGPPVSGIASFETADSDLSDWNTHWLAYSSYDAIVLTGREWGAASRNVRKAIERWMLCGGHLYVLGSGYQSVDVWPNGKSSISSRKIKNMGLGSSCVFEGDIDAAHQQIVDDLDAKKENPIPLLGNLQEGVDRLHNEDHGYYGYRSGPFSDSETDFNRYFPVVDSSRVPVRLVVGLLTLFLILAGPVTLVFLSRKGKRFWFLWMLPAISFVVSALVFIMSFLSEGITPRIRMASVTLLDQVGQEATTIGGTAIYAPLSPGILKFDGTSEVTPLYDPNSRELGGSRRVTWTDGGKQHFDGSWISSRVPAHFAIRKSEHREERLQVNWLAGDIPEVLNGLGGHINELYLCRSDGTLFTGENIIAGKKVKLREVTDTRGRSSFRELPEFTKAALEFRAVHGGTLPRNLLVAGVYWASLSNSPFLENPLEGRSAKLEVESHIIGILGYGNSGKPTL